MDIAAAVDKGIAFLDNNGPEGWRSRIDVDELDVSSTGDCVLGQIYSHFDEDEMQHWRGWGYGVRILFKDNFSFELACSLGFDAMNAVGGTGSTEDYNAVTREWQRRLA